jgi:exosortase/archaeosortase family protein
MALRFILAYFGWLGILFGLLYWDLSPLSQLPNDLLRDGLIHTMEALLPPGQVKGWDIWINPHYKLIIEKACNGMIPVLMYLASIFAFPASWKRRIVWGIGGSVLLLVLNVVRIRMVVYFVTEGGRRNFSLSHDLLGNGLFMVVGLGLFFLFIRGGRNETDTKQ